MIVKLGGGVASTPPGLRPILPKPPLQSEAKLNGDRVPPSIVPLSQSGSGLIDGSFSTLKRPLRPAEPAKMAPTIPQSSVNLRKRKSPPASSYETRGNAKRVEPTSKVSSMRAVPSPAKPGPTASSSNPRSEPLDFSQIRTSAPGVMPPRIKNRLFGLEHCPVFYPSHTEFTKPLEYIERIAVALKGSHYGICKIVPPENWQPPFALDTETFRFKTRLQKLHSMEATARATFNFLEQLYAFHAQYKKSDVCVPTLGGRTVNLWLLRKEVNRQGGLEEVNENRKWSYIGKNMGFDVKADPSIGGQLKHAYCKIVQPFEEYRLKHDVKLSTPSSHGGMRQTPSTGASHAVKGKAREHTPLNVTMEQVQAASDKLNTALNASPLPPTAPAPDALGSSLVTVKSEESDEWIAGDACEICRTDDNEESILLCDDCDKGFHLQCLDPPLETVPKGQWLCGACILGTGDDYGFEEGSEHTFATYHGRAKAFRDRWLKKHPPPARVSEEPLILEDDAEDWALEQEIEDHVEREFWKIISSKEKVEVEYGADLHTTQGGSAIPTKASHPFEPYSKDGWNLNNLPMLEGSLLRHVKSDISGMTVPWGYVGMLFSTFAWHKEDHYTYSVNYHHIGGTKTWYGVPGEDDVKLEDTMKAAAPELFQQQPDLMWQLVTLMSPGKLKKAGVRVTACDQRPNEFVITFPKAYHAGFNHDFNYNEAVNFCLPDWLPYDLQCMQRYREVNKAPVFSHDELLVTIAQRETSEKISRVLHPLLEEMVIRELSRRKLARHSIANLEEMEEETQMHPDEYYHCLVDKSYCFLSHLVVPGSEAVACAEHHDKLPAGPRIMKVRYSDSKLEAMLEIVRQRAGILRTGPKHEPSAESLIDKARHLVSPLDTSVGLPSPPPAPTITHYTMEQIAPPPPKMAYCAPAVVPRTA